MIASEPVRPECLRAALSTNEHEREVLVMAPALHSSMLRFWMSDADQAISEADKVQRQTVERLEREGIDARGDTAESTVTEAIEDALVTFPADRIVLFVHPDNDEQYGEHVEVEELAHRVGLPIERYTVAAPNQ